MQNNWQSLHQKFSEYGRNAKEWIRKCQELLPEIEKQKIWKRKGFSSIYVYAYQLAGMNQNQVDECLRVLNKISDKPALMKVFQERGLQKVRPIAAIATIETQNFWAEKANIMTKNTLEAYVQSYRKEFLPREDSQSVKSTITMDLDLEIADQLNKLKGVSDWNTLMKEFLELKKAKLEAEKPKIVEAKSHNIPAKIEKYIFKRTNSTCSFPGCNKPGKIIHHTDRLAMYWLHDPDKMILLCKAHERLAHLGLIENEHLDPQFWKIRQYADTNDPKYEIDSIVQKYRDPERLQQKSILISSA